MPILASLNPNCERFSFRVFWIRCAVTVNCTSLALNLRWVAQVILFHLRFLFIRLPSSRRCGLAETVGLCFRVDSDCVTLGFVLGLVCVCVFVLFCSVVVVVVVVVFVIGRQQHCRYIVIDAMVYPKNWSLEDEFSTEETSGVFGLNLVFLHLGFRDREDFEFGSYDIMHESNEMSFGWCFIIYFVFWKTCSSLTIFWSWMWSGTWTFFLRIIEYYWYPYMAVMWVDEMSCRKGVWKFDTLWEHPLGKGEATGLSSWLYSFMHRRYVEGYYKSSSRHVYAEDWQRTLYLLRKESCMWPTCITIFY